VTSPDPERLKLEQEARRTKPWRLGRQIATYLGWGYGLSMLAWVTFHSIPLAWGALASAAVDRIAGARPGPVVWILAVLVGVGVARGLIFYGAVLIWTHTYNYQATLMRRNVLARIVRGPGRARVPSSPGEAVSRFRDDVNEYLYLLDLWLDTAGAILFGSVAVVLMARINPGLTAVAILPMLGVLVVMQAASPWIRRFRRESRRTTAAVTGFVGEISAAALAVKLSSATDGALDRFEDLSEERRKAAIKDRLLVEGTDAASANLVALSIGIVLLLGASSIRDGSFTVGELTLFVVYLDMLAVLPRRMGRLMARTKRAGVSIVRLTRMMGGAGQDALGEHTPVHLRGDLPEVSHPPKAPSDHLERLDVRNLTCIHRRTQRGVRNVTFSLERGSFTVICGRIGSGKTTLLRALLGLVDSEGEIRWNGDPVNDPLNFFVPPRTAYTPQVPRLFSESLRDNVLLSRPPDTSDLDHSIRTAVFEEDLGRMEQGLETLIGPRGVRLSGGQVQRAAAARMFVTEAELLVFDDLSSALDVETERTLWQRVFERGQSTCLVVSHRRPALRRADQIIVLNDGEVEAIGLLEELLGRSETLRGIWTSEAGEESSSVRGVNL
jgi:ATP-binding cassette, subfamily B, bacterial